MKKYKLKQTIVVTVTGAQVMAVIIKAGEVFNEKGGYTYFISGEPFGSKITFYKDQVESTPELFELVTEE